MTEQWWEGQKSAALCEENIEPHKGYLKEL